MPNPHPAALFSIAILFLALTGASPAKACLREVKITAQLVEDAQAAPLLGFEGNAYSPPFLIGHLSYLREEALGEDGDEAHGAIIFVERGGNWRAFLPQAGEAGIGAFVSIASPLVLIATQLQIEGPGQSFSIMRSVDSLRTGACVSLPFPKALNRGGWRSEYLELHSLQLNTRGRGRLIGSAALGADSPRPYTRWWCYRTRSAGRSWSRAHALPGARAPRPGVLQPIDAPASPAMLASLASFARTR